MESQVCSMDELFRAAIEPEAAGSDGTPLEDRLHSHGFVGWLVLGTGGRVLGRADELAGMPRQQLDALTRETLERMGDRPTCAFLLRSAKRAVLVLAARLADPALIGVCLQQYDTDAPVPEDPLEITRRVCTAATWNATQISGEYRRLQTRIEHRRAERDMMQSLQQQAFAGTLVEREERIRQQELRAEWERLCRLSEEASRAKTEFLSNVSHELRTPLTAILGYAELLLGTPVDSVENRRHLETIRRNGEHLLRLIEDILSLSMLEAGRMELQTTSVAPWSVINDVAEMMRPRAEERGLDFHVEYLSPLPAVIQTDPVRLRQVLVHLAGNAVKFTEQGSVHIRARCVRRAGGSAQLQIEVADTGIGIDPTLLQELFTPFTQGDSSAVRSFQGVGLGLTIAQRLTRLLGGNLEVCSRAGRGSVFTVSIDCGALSGVSMVSVPPEEQTAPTDSLPPEEPPQQTARILLAEDGADNRRLIRHLLQKAGYEVTIAENGREAWLNAIDSAAQGKPFDLILMDMQMPEMDGYEATRRLRQAGWVRPIVALTAHAAPEDRRRCLAEGCDGYLAKPIQRARLLDAVSEALQLESTGDRLPLEPPA